jgi:hypothetical protein
VAVISSLRGWRNAALNEAQPRAAAVSERPVVTEAS